MITIDTGFSTIGILQGKTVDILKNIISNVPNKQNKGGQSAPRYQRIRSMAIRHHLTHVAELCKEYFIENKRYAVEGLIIGGPGLVKHTLVADGYLDNRLQTKIIQVVDIGTVSDREGMDELIEQSKEILEGTQYLEEKKIVQKWLDMVYQDNNKAIYGEAEIRKAIELGALATLLVSEDLHIYRIDLTCQSTNESKFITITKDELEKVEANPSIYFSECTGKVLVKDYKDVLEEISENALQQGAHVEIISSSTEEGQQLIHFGGFAGILRYSLSI